LFKRRKLALASSNFRLSALQCYVLGRKLEHIDSTVAARRERCARLEDACRELGLEHCLPAPRPEYFDCPFFFPLKSARKLNSIEPREESPLHRSAIVVAILERFYPDLLKRYYELNPPGVMSEFAGNKVITDIDFINISQTWNLPADQVVSAYKEAVLCRK